LKLKRDEPLSNVASNFNVRRYSTEQMAFRVVIAGTVGITFRLVTITHIAVGRCRLTVSNPVLKARLVPVLETKM
jgi:hypothetical protein